MTVLLGVIQTVIAEAAVVLNEVLYDPAGADGGHEYVELFNNGLDTASLAEVSLQFANGAVGDHWSVRWSGRQEDVLAPGECWLIVDQGWSGPMPDAVAALGLQNGPDAIRLVASGLVIDRLGYGLLLDPALFEGTPHPGAPSGRALARRPDGIDSDHNDSDWTSTDELTPGELNVRLYGLVAVILGLEPPCQVTPWEPFCLELELWNNGLRELGPGTLTLQDQQGHLLVQEPWEPLAPEARRRWTGSWQPVVAEVTEFILIVEASGRQWALPAGEAWVGVPEAAFSEVMAAPDQDAPEWFELVAGSEAVDLAGWSVSDDSEIWRALPSFQLEAGDRAVVTSDLDAYGFWTARRTEDGAPWPCAVDPGRNVIALSASWPTLNNSAAEGEERADRLLLRRPDGLVIDRVAWGGRHLPARPGRSIERKAIPHQGDPERDWNICTAAFGSTPGCRNSSDPYGGTSGGLEAVPAGFLAHEGTTFRFHLDPGEESWDLVLLDLDGRTVRQLGGDSFGPGQRSVVWSGETDHRGLVPPGPLLALLRVRSSGGGLLRRERQLVIIRRGGP